MKKFLMTLMCGVVALFSLTGCQLIQKNEALQEKIISAAKQAVIKVACEKIDKREDLDDITKAALKEVAKNFIEKTFERLEAEYKKLSQKEIEDDATAIIDDQLAILTSSYKLKLDNK